MDTVEEVGPEILGDHCSVNPAELPSMPTVKLSPLKNPFTEESFDDDQPDNSICESESSDSFLFSFGLVLGAATFDAPSRSAIPNGLLQTVGIVKPVEYVFPMPAFGNATGEPEAHIPEVCGLEDDALGELILASAANDYFPDAVAFSYLSPRRKPERKAHHSVELPRQTAEIRGSDNSQAPSAKASSRSGALTSSRIGPSPARIPKKSPQKMAVGNSQPKEPPTNARHPSPKQPASQPIAQPPQRSQARKSSRPSRPSSALSSVSVLPKPGKINPSPGRKATAAKKRKVLAQLSENVTGKKWERSVPKKPSPLRQTNASLPENTKPVSLPRQSSFHRPTASSLSRLADVKTSSPRKVAPDKMVSSTSSLSRSTDQKTSPRKAPDKTLASSIAGSSRSIRTGTRCAVPPVR